MSESLETKYLSIPLVAIELPLSQAQENPRRSNKKLIAGVSGLLVLGCVIATVCIPSTQAPLNQDAIQLSSFQDSTILASKSKLKLIFSQIDSLQGVIRSREPEFYLSEDGKYFAYPTLRGSIVVRSLESSSTVFETKGGFYEASQLYLSSDSKTVYNLAYKGQVCLVISTEESVKTIYPKFPGVTSYGLSQDNKYAIFFSSDFVSVVNIVNIETEEIVYTLELYGRRYDKGNGPRLSDDRKYIIYSEEDVVKILEVETQKIVHSIIVREEVYDAKLSPDNQYLVYHGFEKNLGVVNVSTLDHVFFQSTDDFKMSRLQFSNDNSLIALNGRNNIKLIDLKNNSVVWSERNQDNVQDFAFSKDGKYLISTLSGELRVFSLQELKDVYKMKIGDTRSSIKFLRAAEEGIEFHLYMQSDESATILALGLI